MHDTTTRRAIRAARQALGWTQAKLGKKASVSRPKLSLYERGQVELTPEELKRVEDAVQDAKIPRRFAHELQRKFRRQQAGLSQQELANAAGIDRSKLSRWESGLLELSGEELARVERALGRTPSSLASLLKEPDLESVESVRHSFGSLENARTIVELGKELGSQEKQIETLEALVAVYKEFVAELQGDAEDKEQKIAELERKVALLEDLCDVKTTGALANAKEEELREKLSVSVPDTKDREK